MSPSDAYRIVATSYFLIRVRKNFEIVKKDLEGLFSHKFSLQESNALISDLQKHREELDDYLKKLRTMRPKND